MMKLNRKIFNFDKDKPPVKGESFSYGLSEGADIRATDINTDENGSNFKIVYKGNIVPFWAKGVVNTKDIYAVLERIAEAISEGKNLVEISNNIKNNK